MAPRRPAGVESRALGKIPFIRHGASGKRKQSDEMEGEGAAQAGLWMVVPFSATSLVEADQRQQQGLFLAEVGLHHQDRFPFGGGECSLDKLGSDEIVSGYTIECHVQREIEFHSTCV